MQGETYIKPLSELFTEEQMKSVPIDNKVRENYFGQMTNQSRAKGGQSFKAVGERLVLQSNADIAFGEGAENMMKDKELKKILKFEMVSPRGTHSSITGQEDKDKDKDKVG